MLVCQSWVGFTVGMFEFEYPTGTVARPDRQSPETNVPPLDQHDLKLRQELHNTFETMKQSAL
jgi:hypothetical protein